MLIQPMAAGDVARAVGKVAAGAPLNGTIEIAGPEAFPLDELVRRDLSARQDPRRVVADPHAEYFGTELAERSLVPDIGAAQLGATRFEDWLAQSVSVADPRPRASSPPEEARCRACHEGGIDVRPPARQDPRLVFLEELVEEQATIAGDVIEIDAHTWAIHGSSRWMAT